MAIQFWLIIKWSFNLSVSSHVPIFTIFLHLTGFCYSKLEQCKGQDGKKFKKLIIDDWPLICSNWSDVKCFECNFSIMKYHWLCNLYVASIKINHFCNTGVISLWDSKCIIISLVSQIYKLYQIITLFTLTLTLITKLVIKNVLLV